MKRRDFLKLLGISGGAAVAATIPASKAEGDAPPDPRMRFMLTGGVACVNFNDCIIGRPLDETTWYETRAQAEMGWLATVRSESWTTKPKLYEWRNARWEDLEMGK